jgi:alpha-galactosidase
MIGLDPAGATAPVVVPAGSLVYLRAGGSSLALDLSPRPQLLHWGAPLAPADADPDLDALAVAIAPPVAQSAPDLPRTRPLVPMPVDGWRMRPWLQGARPDGTGWSPDLRLEGATQARGEAGDALRLVLADRSAGLVLTLHLAIDASGVLTVGQLLTNCGDTAYQLGSLAAVLPLPDTAQEVLDLTGRWCRERAPQRHRLAMGAWSREGRTGRTGHDAPTLLVVGRPGFSFEQGELYAVHLAWSGNTLVWAERSPAGRAELGAGELLEPGEVILEPGQSYTAPELLATYSAGGLNGMSARWHEHVRSRPRHPRTPRPVTFNTWEAVYFDQRPDRLFALADTAALVGAERFVLDDGWFGDRRTDRAGLGDWYVSSDVWPDGLERLVEHVRGHGMQFGLWVEPEMVNPDSDLYRRHPDWVLAMPGREPPSWRHQLVLDLGREEVRDYLFTALDAVLTAHDIGFLKWDHNRDLLDAGSSGRAGVHRATLGAYQLLDRLTEAHPEVEIETCASGGGRVDLGMLARTDRIWASDTIDALERQHIQLWTGLLLPPELVGTHVGAPQSHTTGRTHGLSFRAATALFGHFGIEWDLGGASADEVAELAGVVAAYKRLRGLLHSGTVHRLDHPDPSALVHGVVAPDGSEAVFAFVQLEASRYEVPPPVRLTGLAPDRIYRLAPVPLGAPPRVVQAAGPPWLDAGLTTTGRSLAAAGLHLPVLAPEQALLLHVGPDRIGQSHPLGGPRPRFRG